MFNINLKVYSHFQQQIEMCHIKGFFLIIQLTLSTHEEYFNKRNLRYDDFKA